MKNIFDISGIDLSDEFTEILAKSKTVRIERIVSAGHKSSDDFWYDQNEHEYVILLKGYGEIEYENGSIYKLLPGDSMLIPKGKRHRVKYTSELEQTIWLCVFYE